MTTANTEITRPDLKRRLKRVIRRTRKAPIKTYHRLQGYDNSSPILMEPHRAIYFQIPKVASSALKELLRNELMLRGPAAHATRFPAPDPAGLESGTYDDYFKFCFVRNPWSRVVSNYETKIRRGRNINGTRRARALFYVLPRSARSLGTKLSSIPLLTSEMAFDEFVRALARIGDDEADKHVRSLHTFLCDSNGDLSVDYVGRLESFSDDFEYIADRIGLSVTSLPTKRDRKGRSYRDYYNEETWDLVARRYRRDIELLGYGDFEL